MGNISKEVMRECWTYIISVLPKLQLKSVPVFLSELQFIGVMLDFHSPISLVAHEIFAREKCSDIVCCLSEPLRLTPQYGK